MGFYFHIDIRSATSNTVQKSDPKKTYLKGIKTKHKYWLSYENLSIPKSSPNNDNDSL